MKIIGYFIKGIYLVLFRKIRFDRSVVGGHMPDSFGVGDEFRIFRFAQMAETCEPEARFVIQFQLKNMDAQKNITFSLLPMLIFISMPGFYSKYWLVDSETNTCMGIYRWKTIADAKRYSESIAVRFMKKRSTEGSVHYKILAENE